MATSTTSEARKQLERYLTEIGIRRNSNDYREYQRAKLAILAWQCNGSLAIPYERAVRIAADFVGV